MLPPLVVVVDDLYVFGPGVGPSEADPPLLVNPDAVLARAITRQLLQPVPRRHPQVRENLRGVQHGQLPPGSPL
jgi:hypothetical protein